MNEPLRRTPCPFGDPNCTTEHFADGTVRTVIYRPLMTREELRRRADQAWEMAGLAAQDGDRVAAGKHTAEAQEYERQLREIQ